MKIWLLSGESRPAISAVGSAYAMAARPSVKCEDNNILEDLILRLCGERTVDVL
jgi:hypothetical protein